MLVPPLPLQEAMAASLEKTANIASIPALEPLADSMVLPVVLKTGDDVSTDDIVPAGTRVMPFWSNIEKLGEYVFEQIDAGYHGRALATLPDGHVIIGGANYGQGSSRENAALAPRYLGLRVVVALSFARIHWQNLINFGVLPLTFNKPDDYEGIKPDDVLRFRGLHSALRGGQTIHAELADGKIISLHHDLSPRQLEVLVAGGVINWLRQREVC
jgi:aconitate hydratase